MIRTRRAMALVVLALLTTLTSAGIARANDGLGPPNGQSFVGLPSPYTQQLVGVGNQFFGGVAFAPDGDVWVDGCAIGGSSLLRFDVQTVNPAVNGTLLHPSTAVASGAGCGLTNHPNGSMYSNTSSGVVQLDASTGAVLGGPFGLGGDALGIAPDPVSGNLVYVGSDGTLRTVDPGLTTSGTFSTVTTGNFLDGIYFDPSGQYLFVSNRSADSSGFRVTVLDRNGTLVQHVPLGTQEPDGIAFSVNPVFVLTSNTTGTLSKIAFAGNDFTAAPTVTTFGSNGFRGDLSQVGPDGCLYLTQAGTRYDNGTTSGENSIVRLCPGFAPPPGVGPPCGTPSECFVSAVYNDFLGRAVEPGGLAFWSSQLDGGMSPTSFTDFIVSCDEFQHAVVSAAYNRWLGRPADAGGLGFWSSFLAGGGTLEQLDSMLAGSDEYYAGAGGTYDGFVGALYADYLGRSPDPSDITFWTAYGATHSRAGVALAIGATPEGIAHRVAEVYQGVVGRSPDAAGAAYWGGLLAGGMTRTKLLSLMASSAEYITLASTSGGLGAPGSGPTFAASLEAPTG